PTTKLGKAYDAAKSWLDEHEQHLSEKYIAPFRQGLDNMAKDLEDAADRGYTASGAQLPDVARGLVKGTGTMLEQVPVGQTLKETLAANVAPPELGTESRALSTELQVGERAAEKSAQVDLAGLRTREVRPPTKTNLADQLFDAAQTKLREKKGTPV